MEIRGPCHWTWASENSRRVATANEGAKICSVNNIRLGRVAHALINSTPGKEAIYEHPRVRTSE